MEVLRRRFCKAEGDDMFMVGHAGQSHGKTVLRMGLHGSENLCGARGAGVYAGSLTVRAGLCGVKSALR